MPEPTIYQLILTLTNSPDSTSTQTIVQAAVEQKLVACANIMFGVTSVYRWRGKIDQAQEVMLILKIIRQRCAQIEKVVPAHHTRPLPELIVVAMADGLPDHLLAWPSTETWKEIDA